MNTIIHKIRNRINGNPRVLHRGKFHPFSSRVDFMRVWKVRNRLRARISAEANLRNNPILSS